MEMNFPTSREHYKKGKRGIYRVFDINDYKKLKKEMQLRNIALSDPDVETVEEKVIVISFIKIHNQPFHL